MDEFEFYKSLGDEIELDHQEWLDSVFESFEADKQISFQNEAYDAVRAITAAQNKAIDSDRENEIPFTQ